MDNDCLFTHLGTQHADTSHQYKTIQELLETLDQQEAGSAFLDEFCELEGECV